MGIKKIDLQATLHNNSTNDMVQIFCMGKMMKRVFVLISLAVAILLIVGNVFAQDEISNIPEPSLDPEWKFVAKGSDGTTVYVNTRRINYLPKGIVGVWTLFVPRGEMREYLVNQLKQKLTFKGEDPNKAERVWHIKDFGKINCKTHQTAAFLEVVIYSFEETVLYSYSLKYEEWHRIVPESVMEGIEKFVCKKHKEKK